MPCNLVTSLQSTFAQQMQALVECLFERGLVKMIFATETLAAGIHMPARSVIITALEKKAVGLYWLVGKMGGEAEGWHGCMVYKCNV